MRTTGPTTITLAAMLLPLLAVGCTPREEAESGDDQPGSGAAPSMSTAPDTTAAALWAHLQDAEYRTNWNRWPGTGSLYAGQEPHGMLLTTYLNQVGLDALTNRAGTMPAGAVVVKENFAPDSTLAAVTVMYKAAGYDPEHADWFFLKRLADGTVEAAGRVNGCQSCHGGRADNDYLFTGDLN